jgi:hypothetical protein
MGRERPFGNCYICGDYGKLSEEHVPPQSAFNDRKVVLERMRIVQGQVAAENQKDHRHQNGLALFTLCEPCNNETGSWYGPAYAEFAASCANVATLAAANKVVSLELTVYPARVFKQALTILCSTSGIDLPGHSRAVRCHVLSRFARGAIGDLRLFCYLVANTAGRATGVQVIGGGEKLRMVSEFAFWPVGWVLGFDKEPDPKLYEVTHWATDYGYGERRSLVLRLPCLPVSTMQPLDFQTPEQTRRRREQTKKHTQES